MYDESCLCLIDTLRCPFFLSSPAIQLFRWGADAVACLKGKNKEINRSTKS